MTKAQDRNVSAVTKMETLRMLKQVAKLRGAGCLAGVDKGVYFVLGIVVFVVVSVTLVRDDS